MKKLATLITRGDYKMGIVLGPCKRCGKMMQHPHPSGLCDECRKNQSRIKPDIPDLPEPLRYKKE